MKTQLKNYIQFTALAGILFLVFSACSNKTKEAAPVISEMAEYVDPGFGFTMRYPQHWIVNARVGDAHFYSEHGVEMKFREPAGKYPHGAVITVEVKKILDPAAHLQQFRKELAAASATVGDEQSVNVDGRNGVKLPYSATVDKKTVICGLHVLVSKDSLMYDIGFAGFGEHYGANKALFDSSLASFRFH